MSKVKVLLKYPKRSTKEIHCFLLSAFVIPMETDRKLQKIIKPVAFECRSLRLYQTMHKDVENGITLSICMLV